MITRRRRTIRTLGICTVVGLLAVWGTLGGCCSVERNDHNSQPYANPEEESGKVASLPGFDLENKGLPRIRAGTVVGQTAPTGWTNFILMVVPTISQEDLDNAPKLATYYAQMFKFTLLARTATTTDGYRLASLARGFAMTIGDQERIVDPKNTFGADLGTFGGRILADNEKAIDEHFRQIARTPTLIVCDMKALMRRGDDHVDMVLRHAILVDPATGKTYTFIWLLSKNDSGYAVAERNLQFIPENLREARLLSFLRKKFILGMPTGEAIGLVRTPQGEAVAWTPELEKVAAAKEFTKEQLVPLEKELLAIGKRVKK